MSAKRKRQSVTTALPVQGVLCLLESHTPGRTFLGTVSGIFVWCRHTGALTLLAGSVEHEAFRDGQGEQARFDGICCMAHYVDGSLLVCDRKNHAVRRVTMQGQVTTVVGTGRSGHTDGLGRCAVLDNPVALAVHPDGVVYLSDEGNNRVCRLQPTGALRSPEWSLKTLCGSLVAGFEDGCGRDALFDGPHGLCLLRDVLYVADKGNHAIRAIDVSSRVATTVAGDGDAGAATGNAFQSVLHAPTALVASGDGGLLAFDMHNARICRVEPSVVVQRLCDVPAAVAGDGLWGDCHFFGHAGPLFPHPDGGFSLLGKGGFQNPQQVVVWLDHDVAPGDVFGVLPVREKARRLHADHLLALVGDERDADVFFTFPGEKGGAVPAHRWLLRRSDFFCKAFDFDPARTTIPIANEFVTRDLFTTVLRFAYAGVVPSAEDFDSSDGLCQLFRVADFFQVDVLKEQCVELFRKGLRSANVIERFIQAHDYQLPSPEFVVCCEEFLEAHALEFKRYHTDTLDRFCARADLMEQCVNLNQLLLVAL